MEKRWSWMLRNSRGRRDALLTFSAGAVVVVLLKVVLNGVTFTVGGTSFNGGTITAELALAILTTLIPYTWKRVQGAKDEPGTPPAGGAS